MSELAEIIIDNGPYVADQIMPFPQSQIVRGHLLVSAAQMNALREDLIELRERREAMTS
jgi:hypothetical protein